MPETGPRPPRKIRRFAPELHATWEFFPQLARMLNQHTERVNEIARKLGLPELPPERVPDLPQITELLWRMQELLALVQANNAPHIIQNEGFDLTQRPRLNFIGDGVDATDNAETATTDVTIGAAYPPLDFLTTAYWKDDFQGNFIPQTATATGGDLIGDHAWQTLWTSGSSGFAVGPGNVLTGNKKRGHPGIAAIGTGAVIADRTTIYCPGDGAININANGYLGNFHHRFMIHLPDPTVLSLAFGVIDVTGSPGGNIIDSTTEEWLGFKVVTPSSANWFAQDNVTGGASTSTDTGIAISDEWLLGEILWTGSFPGSAAATVTFRITNESGATAEVTGVFDATEQQGFDYGFFVQIETEEAVAKEVWVDFVDSLITGLDRLQPLA